MTVLLDQHTTVVVQGITGSMGRFQCAEMLAYGTKIVAGVSPGHGGTAVEGVPVFNTMREAADATSAHMSIIFVAAARAKTAILEAIDVGIGGIVCVAEFMPVHDAITVRRTAKERGVRLIGPNCSGLISPGKAKLGFYSDEVCLPGDIGVMSKSGTLSYAALVELKRRGIGESTVICVGGDEVKGTTFADCLELFEADPETHAMLLIGEIGGREEELAAAAIASGKISKPVVAFISGRTVPPGRSIGHAGAIITGSRGTYESKVKALSAAGAMIAETLEDIPTLLENGHGR
jgi:succinyl-CoA synthetase alpha subunit